MKLYPDVHISEETYKSIKELQSQLLSLGKATRDSVSAVLGRTAYYGRENIVREEERLFNFGAVYSKGGSEKKSHTTKKWREGYVIIGKSRRLVQYSFENVHSLRSQTAFARSVKSVYVSSMMLNLFEHDTKPYSSASPWINYSKGGFRIQKGATRKGKNFYMADYRGVEKAIPTAIARTEEELQERIDSATR